MSAATSRVMPAKLVPPRAVRTLVTRRRLHDLLDRSDDLTAVIAPAGSGKTTAVSDWVESRPAMRTAWYSLDRLDRSPHVFWSHLLATLGRVIDLGTEIDEMLEERGEATDAIVASLIHVVNSDAGVTLVLDDVHQLTDTTVLDQLALLVDRTRGRLRVVMTGRRSPGLPIARWAIEGRCVQIGADELRFDVDDVMALLMAHGSTATTSVAGSLLSRSEGWVAALQLAMTARPDEPEQELRAPAHDGGLLGSYLAHEIFARVPAEVLDVAQQIAVLDTFDESAVMVLTDRSDALDLLTVQYAPDLFLTRLGGDVASYRFHPLVRDELEARFRGGQREQWRVAHQRAARHLASTGCFDAAFDHYMTIGDTAAAVELVVRPGLALSDLGWGRWFRRWLDQLPVDVTLKDPELLLDLSFANFTAGRLERATSCLDEAAHHLGVSDRRVALRRLAIAIADIDHTTCARVLATLAATPQEVVRGSFEGRLLTTSARAALLLDRLDDVDELVGRARTESDDVARAVAVPALLARASERRGDVDTAVALASESLDHASRLGMGDNPAILEALIALAGAHVGACRLLEAESAVDRLLDVIETVDYRYSRAHAAAILLELTAASSGWLAAAGTIADSDRRAGWVPTEGVFDPSSVARCRALLIAGRIDEARTWRAVVPAGVDAQLLDATAMIAARRFDQVERLLALPRASTPRQQVEALVLSASSTTGTFAIRQLEDATRLAMSTGLRAPFTSHGPALRHLLSGLPPSVRTWVQPAEAPPRATVHYIEPLTPRERDILQLLPTHLSNAELGDRLFISVNTVKTNLRALYRKMNVTSRSEAVDTARRAGLLQPERSLLSP
jgi:LuxR family maltose regulon positive regulatory protein